MDGFDTCNILKMFFFAVNGGWKSLRSQLVLPLSAITSVYSSHHCARPSLCWISPKRDVLCKFHSLFELQSKSSRKWGNERFESPSEGKQIERKMGKNFFCRTGFPLARTRWVQSIFSSHCPLSSNQCHWLTSATLIIFPPEVFWECWELNLGLLSEKQVCYLYAMQPPLPPLCPELTIWPIQQFGQSESCGQMKQK